MWDQSCHRVWDYPVNGDKSVMLQHKVGGLAEARDGAQRSVIHVEGHHESQDNPSSRLSPCTASYFHTTVFSTATTAKAD